MSKEIKELNLEYKIDSKFPFVLVLESLDSVVDDIISFGKKAIDNSIITKIYFLGDSESRSFLTSIEFEREFPSLFNENKNNVSLLRPVFQDLLNNNFEGGIIVISSKPPIDKDDWEKEDIFNRTIFKNFDDINSNPKRDNLIDELKFQISKISSLEEKEFIPLKWCIPSDITKIIDSKFKEEENSSNLEIELNSSSPTFEFYLNCISKELPSLKIDYENGKKQKRYLNIKPKSDIKENICPWEWQELREDIKPVVINTISKIKFSCPKCKKEHDYSTIICPQTGDYILSGIQEGITLLKKEGNNIGFISLEKIGVYAYPIGNSKVISREGIIYDFSGGNLKKTEDKVDFLKKINEELYVLNIKL